MTIQQEYDDQSSDKVTPMGVVTITGMSGSLQLKKGHRVCLIDCSDVTIQGNEGHNEVSISNASSVTVEDFMDGVLRLHKCSDVQSLKATNTKINVGGAQIQQVQLDNCEVNLMRCEVQTGEFTDCDLTSVKNTYQELSIQGGQSHLEDDQPDSLTVAHNARVVGNKIQTKQTVDISKADVTLQALTADGNVTIDDAHVLLVRPEIQGNLDVTGKSSVVAQGLTVTGETTLTDAQAVFSDGEFSGEVTVDNASMTATNPIFTQGLTLTNSNVVLSSGSIEAECTFTDSSVRLDHMSIEGTVDSTDSAIDSTDTTGAGELTMSGGTLTSARDSWSTISATSLVGPNVIRRLTDGEEISLLGDGVASLVVDDCECQSLTVGAMSHARVSSCSAMEMTFADSTMVQITDCNGQVTVNGCGQFLQDGTSNLTQLTVMDTQQAITKDVSDMIAMNTNITDQGSTITATDCNIIGDQSIITTVGGIVQAKGGSVVATGSTLVNTSAGEVTNTGGLTVGTMFDTSMSSGALCYDGNLTLQASVGDVNIIALTGKVNTTALTAITLTAGTNISMLATGSISAEAGLNISQTATGDIEMTSMNITETAGATITQSATAIVQM